MEHVDTKHEHEKPQNKNKFLSRVIMGNWFKIYTRDRNSISATSRYLRKVFRYKKSILQYS